MKELLDTTNIRSLTLKNRFIRAAVADYTPAGHLDNGVLGKYENLAKGGAGTIITGFALVDAEEKAFPIMSMYDDAFVDEYSLLTSRVHRHQTNVVMQLVVTGSYAMGDVTGRTVLGPSAVANLNTGIVPKEMTGDEIKAIQEKFAQAAVRAQKAGFDGVEIHAAHGFLLNQFITPYYNNRKDSYGGPIENRARMVLETCAAIRKDVGPDYPVWVKLNSTDGIEQGLTLDDCLYVSKELARLGVDAIEVSGNWIAASSKKEIYFKAEAAKIAEACRIAVIVTGGNRNYREMEELLNSTGVGYFGMARPFIAEPGLVNRFREEKPAKTKCVSCNGCLDPDSLGGCILDQAKKKKDKGLS